MELRFAFAMYFGLALAFASMAQAQQGPRIPPCTGCPTSSERPYPQSGLWHDPARMGSGFSIEIQNGILGGGYYGYRSDGQPQWYSFSGTLQPSSVPSELWTLDTSLFAFQGGNPIGAAYRAPGAAQPAHRLRLRVLQRNLIGYRIDEGEEFRVLPFVFGTVMEQRFPTQSDHGFPVPADLSAWVFVVRNPTQPAPSQSYLASSRVLTSLTVPLPPGSTAESALILFRDPTIPLTDPPVGYIRFNCGKAENVGTVLSEALRNRLVGSESICVVGYPPDSGSNTIYYVTALANVGDSYFSAVAENGLMLEGYRLRYR